MNTLRERVLRCAIGVLATGILVGAPGFGVVTAAPANQLPDACGVLPQSEAATDLGEPVEPRDSYTNVALGMSHCGYSAGADVIDYLTVDFRHSSDAGVARTTWQNSLLPDSLPLPGRSGYIESAAHQAQWLHPSSRSPSYTAVVKFAELVREHHRVGPHAGRTGRARRLSVRAISDLERGLKQAPRPSTTR